MKVHKRDLKVSRLISEAINIEMELDEKILLFGEDVGKFFEGNLDFDGPEGGLEGNTTATGISSLLSSVFIADRGGRTLEISPYNVLILEGGSLIGAGGATKTLLTCVV